MSLLLLALVSTSVAAELPRIEAHDLDRREVVLPADLEGEPSLLLLGFSRAQQQEVESWRPYASELEGLPVYEVPMMGPLVWFLRPLIEAAMRGARGPAERARMIPTYVAVEPVVEALELPDTTTMAAVLVDREGRVLWMARGPATEEKVAAVIEAAAR